MDEKKPKKNKMRKRVDNMPMMVENEYWSSTLNVQFQIFPKN
jgi:hypothetical protein